MRFRNFLYRSDSLCGQYYMRSSQIAANIFCYVDHTLWTMYWPMHSLLHYLTPLACINMDLRNILCLISTNGHHWERDGCRQKPEPLDNWICWVSAANQLFSVFTNVGGLLLYLLYHALSHDGNAMHFGLLSCHCMYQSSLKW